MDPFPSDGVVVVGQHDQVQLDQVRDLMRRFVAWHRERHVEDLDLIDRYFDASAFEAELSGLPGKYAAPDGSLLLAYCDGAPAGCVAHRRLDASSCEMKRMFVQPRFQGRGVGRRLADEVVARAAAQGYAAMLLDTSVRQVEAQALYRSLGFDTVEPYYDVPSDVRDWLVFLRKDLTRTG